MRSLRGRLMAGTVLGSLLVFSAAGIGLYALIRASLQAEFDRTLTVKAGSLASLVEEDEGKIEMEWESAALPEFSRPHRPEYFELWATTGGVAARSPSLKKSDLGRIDASMDAPAFRPVILPDGRPGRAVALCFRPRRGNEDEQPAQGAGAPATPMTLIVAVETARVDTTLSRIALILIGVCAVSALLAAGVLAGVVQLALRPLGDLAGRIAGLGEADLSTRIDPAAAPAELRPVIGRLNDLLARLQAAFAREKGFTADAAHELRTPLAGLRSTLDVNLSRPREPEAYRAASNDCLAIVRQMQTLVENLLALARLEAGAVGVEMTPIKLHDLLVECWKPFENQARERSLRVVWRIEEPITVETDGAKLRQVLANVLENAATYTNNGGEVSIKLKSAAREACICVTNTGCAFSPDEAEQAFERFWRGDAARHDTGVHCGLGLPLSRRLMEAIGGSIRAECAPGGAFTIDISLPAAQA